MTTEKTYNGWTNYETWLVALWIDNDHYYYDSTRQFVEETKEAGEKDRKSIVWGLAESIKEKLYDEMHETAGSTLIGDLVRASLMKVNYYEIANNIVEEE